MVIRPARPDEAASLGELALRAKAHWGYDEEFLDACRAELTLTPDDVTARRATVAERGGRVVGFYTLAGEPPEVELGHLFVEPAHLGDGFGRALWAHAVTTADALGVERIVIDSDPFAEGFYLGRGAVRTGEAASGSIPGRVLPRLTYEMMTR